MMRPSPMVSWSKNNSKTQRLLGFDHFWPMPSCEFPCHRSSFWFWSKVPPRYRRPDDRDDRRDGDITWAAAPLGSSTSSPAILQPWSWKRSKIDVESRLPNISQYQIHPKLNGFIQSRVHFTTESSWVTWLDEKSYCRASVDGADDAVGSRQSSKGPAPMMLVMLTWWFIAVSRL